MNISPKMSYGVLECDIVTQLHAYDFVIKDFIINRGIICARPCIYLFTVPGTELLKLLEFPKR